MAKRHRRGGKFVRDNPKDDPLGIGVSTKTLTLIGVGIVAAIALKWYLNRRKAAAASTIPALPPASGGERLVFPPGAVTMNGVPKNPVSPTAAGPASGPTGAQMPQSVNPGGSAVNGSRANYEGAGGFSGMGDGMLDGANGRM